MFKQFILPFCITLPIVFLTACGSSSDGEEEVYADSYLQFYNGSANSATTFMGEVDGGTLSSAAYGDSSSLISAESGEVELEFYRMDADDQEILLEELTATLADGEKLLLVLSGDYESPTINEYRFEREELEDHFRLFGTSVITDVSSYDLYMSDAGTPFSAANFLGTLNYNGFVEMAYWDTDSDSDDFDEGDYILYLTEPGASEPFFESATVSFNFDTEYVLVLRTTAGAIKNSVAVDLIINSSTVSSYADADAAAQYRVYNSIDVVESLNLSLDGNDGTTKEIEVSSNALSQFEVVDFGDYRLSAVAEDDETINFNNRLVTLNQGQSKAIVLYQDKNDVLSSLSFDESTLPQIFEHQIQIANLLPDFLDIDLYFVRSDETIETAEYQISSLDFAESRSLSIPSGYYELIAVYDDNTDAQVLLDRTALVGINEEANYIITVEKTDDSVTGYKISLLF
ncbi:MAG: hypothetical protein ACI88A_001541 [Paraglaciecola sp.]|jgi:hypothetical protein